MALTNIIACRIFILFLIFDGGWAKPSTINNIKASESKLIVISMDGLMFEQIELNSMPFVTELLKNGVHCPKLQPVFPTKTLVNHFSIATGTSKGVNWNLFTKFYEFNFEVCKYCCGQRFYIGICQ